MGETRLQIHSLTLNNQTTPCPTTETGVEELLEHALVNERKSKNVKKNFDDWIENEMMPNVNWTTPEIGTKVPIRSIETTSETTTTTINN